MFSFAEENDNGTELIMTPKATLPDHYNVCINKIKKAMGLDVQENLFE